LPFIQIADRLILVRLAHATPSSHAKTRRKKTGQLMQFPMLSIVHAHDLNPNNHEVLIADRNVRDP
jgi:hypothetical protein